MYHYGNIAKADGDRAFSCGLNTGLYYLKWLAKEGCKLDPFTKAVEERACAYPLLRPRLIKGLGDCAKHDDKIDAVEQEIICAIAVAMDCPQPIL